MSLSLPPRIVSTPLSLPAILVSFPALPFIKSFPEPPTLFDNYEGRGSASRQQDMTIEKTLTYHDLKLTPQRGFDTKFTRESPRRNP